jgi:hypothetical protein
VLDLTHFFPRELAGQTLKPGFCFVASVRLAPVRDSAGVETIGTQLTGAGLTNSAGRVLNTIHPEPEPGCIVVRNAAATDVFGETSQVP